MKDSCENCRYLAKDDNGNDICERNGCFLPSTSKLCKRWAMKRFPKQAQRKKPQKCNIIYQGEVIATIASRHHRKIEDFLREHMKAIGNNKGDYRIDCFYCKEPLAFIESSLLSFMVGVGFCPYCFPEEHKQQQEFFELQ